MKDVQRMHVQRHKYRADDACPKACPAEVVLSCVSRDRGQLFQLKSLDVHYIQLAEYNALMYTLLMIA